MTRPGQQSRAQQTQNWDAVSQCDLSPQPSLDQN